MGNKTGLFGKLARLAIINGKAVPAAEHVSIDMKTNTMSSGAA